jgi:hypothetical protein
VGRNLSNYPVSITHYLAATPVVVRNRSNYPVSTTRYILAAALVVVRNRPLLLAYYFVERGDSGVHAVAR